MRNLAQISKGNTNTHLAPTVTQTLNINTNKVSIFLVSNTSYKTENSILENFPSRLVLSSMIHLLETILTFQLPKKENCEYFFLILHTNILEYPIQIPFLLYLLSYQSFHFLSCF